jgi:hypothetical protein
VYDTQIPSPAGEDECEREHDEWRREREGASYCLTLEHEGRVLRGRVDAHVKSLMQDEEHSRHCIREHHCAQKHDGLASGCMLSDVANEEVTCDHGQHADASSGGTPEIRSDHPADEDVADDERGKSDDCEFLRKESSSPYSRNRRRPC